MKTKLRMERNKEGVDNKTDKAGRLVKLDLAVWCAQRGGMQKQWQCSI